MQIALVYIERFRRNSLLKCVLQPEIAKNSRKPLILGVQGRSRSSMLVPPESSSAVLVMISSKPVSIWNHSRARLVDSSRNCKNDRSVCLMNKNSDNRKYGPIISLRIHEVATALDIAHSYTKTNYNSVGLHKINYNINKVAKFQI